MQFMKFICSSFIQLLSFSLYPIQFFKPSFPFFVSYQAVMRFLFMITITHLISFSKIAILDILFAIIFIHCHVKSVAAVLK